MTCTLGSGGALVGLLHAAEQTLVAIQSQVVTDTPTAMPFDFCIENLTAIQ